MARKISSRLKISGVLLAITPLHIGGNGDDPLVDLSLAQNGAGQHYVPGTSLAGALRAWMDDSNFVNRLWGFQEEGGRNGHASYVLVDDAPIEGVVAEIRDGVGIDRLTGTAAERVKFDRAILPKGSRIPLHITVEQGKQFDAAEWEVYKAEFVALLQALQEQEIRVGAAKTRGLGRIQLAELSIQNQDLSTPDGMIAALRGEGTGITLGSLSSTPISCNRQPKLFIDIHWQPVGPVMVKAEADGIAVDSLPLVSAIDNKLSFVLPGSSIKGSLRTQAERIIRTLLNCRISNNPNPNQRFIEQVQNVPLVQSLFGSAARLADNTDTADKKQLGKMGALAIDDCYAQISMNPEQWSSIEAAETEVSLRGALQGADLQGTQQAFHVAIDRWTGGAAEGFLYSTLEPMGFEWDPIRLTLDLSKLEAEANPALALLLLVLRDLLNGLIPIGYGTNRGMGAIAVHEIKFQSKGSNPFLAPLHSITLTQSSFDTIPEDFLEKLTFSWQQWLQGVNVGEQV